MPTQNVTRITNTVNVDNEAVLTALYDTIKEMNHGYDGVIPSTGALLSQGTGVTVDIAAHTAIIGKRVVVVQKTNQACTDDATNYVFEKQMTDLQNGDRFYYLLRTPGMNLRAQLEGNSFAELMMRNTNAHSLKADAFATADCKFQMSKLAGTTDGWAASGPVVADDGASECREDLLLLRKPDGTIQYREKNTVDPSGINGQAVYNGTAGVDRMTGGNDNDTFLGNEGNDVIEGQGGDDIALGGEGNDRITDRDLGRVAQAGDREVGTGDLEHGEVGERITADDLRRLAGPVAIGHPDRAGCRRH